MSRSFRAPSRRSRPAALAVVALLATLVVADAGGAETATGRVDAAGNRFDRVLVDVTQSSVLSVDLSWSDPDADLRLFVKGPGRNTVAWSTAPGPGPRSLVVDAAEIGTWSVWVKAHVGASDYRLDTGLQPVRGRSGTFAGRVDADGPRWIGHGVDVTEPSILQVTLAWDGPADLDLIVKDQTGVVTARSRTGRNPETLTIDARGLGNWRLAARAVTGAADYEMRWSLTPLDDPGPRRGNGVEWPMFGYDSRRVGTAGDPTITAANVASLGLDWQANTGAPVYASPVVVRDRVDDRMLVVVGNQEGAVTAFDADSGARVWAFTTRGDITSTPTVDEGVVYVGSTDDHMYALDLHDGAEICSFRAAGSILASPLIADPDGSGKALYFGDIGITGADDGGNFWAVEAVEPGGRPDCSLRWEFNGFGEPEGSAELAGSWSSASIGRTSTGRSIVVFGGSSPDNAIYGVDAVTGERVWRFAAQIFAKDNDVGAAPNVFDAGTLGFADGVAFVAGKNRIVHALDLADGSLLWEFSIRDDAPRARAAVRSTMSFDGERLYLGFGHGVYAFDARTGTKLWRSDEVGPATIEILTIPTLSSPGPDAVLFAGDLSGTFFAFRAATGERLWEHRTGNFVYASPTPANGRLYAASADGFVYAFVPGGAPPGRPETTIDHPVDATLANPGGPLTIRGTATDATCLAEVLVAIKDRNANRYWNPGAGRWQRDFVQFAAILDRPAATTTTWAAAFDVPFAGSNYYAQAEAVDCAGSHDPRFPRVEFFVPSLGNPPETTIDEPRFREIFSPPGGVWQRFPITITGTATDDPDSADAGISRVRVGILNIEHGEYYCGANGCGGTGGEATDFQPAFTTVDAELDDPGAATTTWSLTFPVYDHEHKYRIVAWAIDVEGEEDSTRAVVQRICIREPGDRFCA